ncbi:MAG: class I SAM-dependent methyltransferase [Thermoplasmatota archaeon]
MSIDMGMPEEELKGSFAESYDDMTSEYRSFGGNVLFGLQFDRLSPGERLLDIGIGTGLSSQRYGRYGLEVYGVDISREMLFQCERKDFAKELKVLDISKDPLPYDDGFFHHGLAHGVLHFFEDLSFIFREAARVIKTGGTFVFTTMCGKDGGPVGDGIENMDTEWGRKVILHGRGYVEKVAEISGFELMDSLLFVGGVDPEDGEMFHNWAYLLRRKL